MPQSTLNLLFEYVWVPIGAGLVWTIKKIFGLEKSVNKDIYGIHTQLAVLETQQESISTELKRVDERNEVQHQKIEDKIDLHNDRVMTRLDSLLKIAKNGSG